ncbi:hypothetical protein [Thalassotalea euphylliae]|uniref:Uncharacterized protein n=1 Tax=Thalassotalea euphylliae TaxID=1655234 RepID=A0A3E0U0K5_9GAMM|nr:hypothetical protein [Thalassotalea euphylliae]REL30107.1 hypothetical protein DXX94_04990 [Thalassotalea euphylliae]
MGKDISMHLIAVGFAMDKDISMHLITVGFVFFFKITTLLVGYLICRLGYDLLIKGVSGEFKFKGKLKGAKADLVSASPGVFFVFLGVVLLSVAVFVDKPFETHYGSNSSSGGGKNKNLIYPELPEKQDEE